MYSIYERSCDTEEVRVIAAKFMLLFLHKLLIKTLLQIQVPDLKTTDNIYNP